MAMEGERATSSSSQSSSRKRKFPELDDSKSCFSDSLKDKKIVNWKLACFMANEYITKGTLLGKKVEKEKNELKGCSLSETHKEEDVRKQREKQKEELYFTIMDLLTTEDVHLPGIINPTQLVAWMG